MFAMKKQNHSIRIFLFSLMVLVSGNLQAAAKTYKIIPADSKIAWNGKKVTGAHDGNIQVKDGEVVFNKKKLESAKIVMDMTSISNNDLTDKEYNDKLVGHLKSEDFFSSEKHPEATFVSSKVEKQKGDMYKISGDLTIKGITKPATIEAKVTEKGGKVVAEGSTKLDRTQWEVKYGSGKFFENLGDKMINDEFELTFNIAAK